MLRRALDLLKSRGWLDTHGRYDAVIYLSHGSAHSALVRQEGSSDVFIKFTSLLSLANEAERCALSSRRFPDHTATFIGHAIAPPLEVLVSRAVEFRPINGRGIHGARDRRALTSELEALFRAMRDGGAHPARLSDSHAWFAPFRAYCDAHLRHLDTEIAVSTLEQSLAQLPEVPQHGDLVLNNLGVRSAHRLVVFDWEDYGAVSLAGLDLFTLETSLGNDLDRPSTRSGTSGVQEVLDTDRLCRALGLDRGLYERLKPAYALVFRYLKRNYGPDVRSRFDVLASKLTGGPALGAEAPAHR